MLLPTADNVAAHIQHDWNRVEDMLPAPLNYALAVSVQLRYLSSTGTKSGGLFCRQAEGCQPGGVIRVSCCQSTDTTACRRETNHQGPL